MLRIERLRGRYYVHGVDGVLRADRVEEADLAPGTDEIGKFGITSGRELEIWLPDDSSLNVVIRRGS